MNFPTRTRLIRILFTESAEFSLVSAVPDPLPRTTSRPSSVRERTAPSASATAGSGAVLLDPDASRHRRLRHLRPEDPAEFGQAIAIAKGTPANPLTEPEDLFDAKIVGVTPQAESLGIRPA